MKVSKKIVTETGRVQQYGEIKASVISFPREVLRDLQRIQPANIVATKEKSVKK